MLYQQLNDAGYDILYFDEDRARLGSMLADAELMGIPYRLVVGDRGIDANTVEFRDRRADDNEELNLEKLLEELAQRLA